MVTGAAGSTNPESLPQDTTPSLSAAEALAASPFFCELSPVDLARLVPDLEELHIAASEVIFHQNVPAEAGR
jgi:hypothetical protein